MYQRGPGFAIRGPAPLCATRHDPAYPMRRVLRSALRQARPALVTSALLRLVGRYQLRLATGRAALQQPEAARRWARRAVRTLTPAGDADPSLATALATVATCSRSLGQLDEAEQAQRQAVARFDAVDPDSAASITARVELADLLRFSGQLDAAAAFLRQTLDSVPSANSNTDCSLKAGVLNALGIVCKDSGRYDEAEELYGHALTLLSSRDGMDHPSAAAVWHNIAGLAHARGHPADAIPAAERAIEIRQHAVGPDHHLVAQDVAVLGAALLDLGRTNDAEQAFTRALAIFRTRHPADQYEVAVNLSNLAICRHKQGDDTGAEALLLEGLTLKQSVLGPTHPELARQLNNLAVVVEQQDRARRSAEPVRASAPHRRTHPRDPPPPDPALPAQRPHPENPSGLTAGTGGDGQPCAARV